MSKYIIELGEDANMVQVISVTQSGNAYIDSTVYVGHLEQLNSDYINEHFGDLQDTAYQKGINDGSLDVKQRVEGAYQKGFEDGKAQSERGCEGCQYQTRTVFDEPCVRCSNAYKSQWKAEPKPCDIIRNGIQNWITELNVRAEDIASILEDMRND